MATAIARPPKFSAALNIPQIIAINAIPGRLCPSGFGPSEVVFDLTDGRPWYVPQVIADEIYAAGIQPRQQIKVTGLGRKKTEVSIEPLQPELPRRTPERDYTPELSRSIEQVQGYGLTLAQRTAAPVQLPHPQAGPLSPTSLRYMGAYKDAVDTLLETQGYAKSKGLLIDIRCEDVRCLAATMMIQVSKDAGGR